MAINRLIRKLFHIGFLLKRPMTLGVRILVENEAGEVLLVRHTYVDGWYFPGGGVETGEDVYLSAAKELIEETGIQSTSQMKLLWIFHNKAASKRDHVVFFKCVNWDKAHEFEANREIAEIGFFPIDKLPAGVTKATRRRIEEVLSGQQFDVYW